MKAKRPRNARTRMMLILELAVILPAATLVILSARHLQTIQRDKQVEAAIQRDFSQVLAISEKHINHKAYELADDVPGQRMVTRITDTDLGYSGKWTYVFAPEGPNTRVSITEDGEVSNVIFRFLSRYAFGHTATLDTYLTSLGKQFGETITPE